MDDYSCIRHMSSRSSIQSSSSSCSNRSSESCFYYSNSVNSQRSFEAKTNSNILRIDDVSKYDSIEATNLIITDENATVIPTIVGKTRSVNIKCPLFKSITFSHLAHMHIHELIMVGCNLTEIVPCISSMHVLRTLNLMNNNITSIPISLFKCRKLELLQLSHNSISVIPAEISDLTRLATLDVSYNEIDCFPYTMIFMGSLKHLLASGNPFLTDESGNNYKEVICSNCCRKCIIDDVSRVVESWKRGYKIESFSCCNTIMY